MRWPKAARPKWACPVGSEVNPRETATPCCCCCCDGDWRRRTQRPEGSRSCPRVSSCSTGCPACGGSGRSPCDARRAAADSTVPEESRCCRALPRRRAFGRTGPDAGALRSPRRPCSRSRRERSLRFNASSVSCCGNGSCGSSRLYGYDTYTGRSLTLIQVEVRFFRRYIRKSLVLRPRVVTV